MQEGKVKTYVSKQLKLHERNNLRHDLELAAMVYALKIWRHYHFREMCNIYMDHKSLQYIFDQNDLNLDKGVGWNLLKSLIELLFIILERLTSWLMHWIEKAQV